MSTPVSRVALLWAVLMSVATAAARAQVETLPTEHWAYAELEHFERRGYVVLDGIRPWTRKQFHVIVGELASDTARFSNVERQRLEKLQQEFVVGGAPRDAAKRYDTPVVTFQESEWSVLGDIGVIGGGAGSTGSAAGAAADGTAWGVTQLEAVVSYGQNFVYETRYNLSMQEEAGQRVDENFVSSRERNWRGLTSNNDRAYVAFESERFRISLGRDQVAWGARPQQELLLASSSPTWDALQVRLRLGRVQLASVAALLSSTGDRYYGAHRLELDLGAVRLGFQEAVIYVSSQVEPTYLFPLSSYYANQFNERKDDNVLLGFDAKWSSPFGLISGEFLMDDFIYDGDPAPNKLGVSLGWGQAYNLWNTDLDVRLGYVALSRWTYTHRQTANAYASGSGDLGATSALLGNSLGPDADRLKLRLGWSPQVDWQLSTSVAYARRGTGNFDRTAWEPGDAFRLRFPSGMVVYETTVQGDVQVRVHRIAEFQVGAGVGRSAAGNEGIVSAEIRVDL